MNKIFIENQCYMLGCVQTDATTLNIVAPTMLGVAACVLAVVCKRTQQFPSMLGPAVHRVVRIQPISLCKPCVMSVLGPNNVGRAVQTDATLLRYASAITEQKKCWELLAEMFDRFQTLRDNIQQHATGCANGRNMYHPTKLRVVGQQCCVRLHGALQINVTWFFGFFSGVLN